MPPDAMVLWRGRLLDLGEGNVDNEKTHGVGPGMGSVGRGVGAVMGQLMDLQACLHVISKYIREGKGMG